MWMGLMIAGAMFLITGFAIWFIFLAVMAFLSVLEVSRHMHQAGFHLIQPVSIDWFVALGYGGAFFLAAAAVARSRWSCRPSMASFVAYAAYLMAYLPHLDWTRGSSSDSFILFVPLITAPLGGLIGERLFAKNRDDHQLQR